MQECSAAKNEVLSLNKTKTVRDGQFFKPNFPELFPVGLSIVVYTYFLRLLLCNGLEFDLCASSRKLFPFAV
jgi:hypothetical protein